MSNYTENKNGVSSFNAGQCAQECECGCTPGNDCFNGNNKYQDNWGFLNDWDTWSDEEKALLFVPHIQYVSQSNVSKDDMGDQISMEIAKRVLKYHTPILGVDFHLTSNSQIVTQIKYVPVYQCIPNDHPLKNKITSWGDSALSLGGLF